MYNSQIYKEISTDEKLKIVRNLYGNNATIKESKILKGGLFNTTYLLRTSEEKSGIVLRVAPINKHLLLDYEMDMMAAEPMFHQMLHDQNVPTTKVLQYVKEGNVIDREYIILEYMDTIPMNDQALEGLDLSYLYEEVGELTHRIHQIKNDKFGWKRLTDWGLFDSWYEFISFYAKELVQKALQFELLSSAEISRFSEIIGESKGLLEAIKTPNMAHTDLWQGNVLLKKQGDHFEIGAIIDLDRVIFGDKYWDLSNPWMTTDLFLQGYGDEATMTADDFKRCELYKMLFGLSSTYICLVEYDDKEWSQGEKKTTLEILNKW